MNPTFEDFWEWLRQSDRDIENLGRRGTFDLGASGKEGTCKPRSTKKEHKFTKDHAKQTWERFWELPEDERFKAGQYVDPNFWRCPNRTCCPWIAAAIRDFLSGRP